MHGLNPPQREAVLHVDGPLLVLAGAGSGKTRVLTHRIAWLNEVYRVPAHGILAVTFTNKASGEMRGRADALLSRGGSRPGSRGMWIGTFHGLAHRLLRLHWQDAKLPEAFQVLDSEGRPVLEGYSLALVDQQRKRKLMLLAELLVRPAARSCGPSANSTHSAVSTHQRRPARQRVRGRLHRGGRPHRDASLPSLTTLRPGPASR